MPYLAHIEFGFIFAPELTEEAKAAGWVLCDDVLKFRDMGYGKGKLIEPPKEEPADAQSEKRKPGRPKGS